MTSKNNQNGSNLLVTTPLDGTWGENEDIVFLGEWCKEYFKKTEWTAREHVVIPYHWKNQKKFGEDYDYLNNLYEYMLSEVSLRLNSIHKVNYSLQYWRIIVGPWLLTYIPAIWDRWENIILLSDLNMKLKTVIPRSSKFRVVPCDYNAAVNLVSNSNEWNYLIYCDILKVQNISTIELIKKNVFFKTRVPNVNKKIKSLTQVFAELFDLVARKIWISDSYNILIYNGYFSIINLIKLNIKLKQIPRLFFEFDEIAKCGEPDLFMRSGLGRDLHSKHSKHSKHFESFLLSNIFVDMPVSYLEGYKDIFSQCKNLPSAKVIMTAGSTFDNELFKSWTAKQVENGSKLIIGEHGGSIPEKRSGVFNHEEDS